MGCLWDRPGGFLSGLSGPSVRPAQSPIARSLPRNDAGVNRTVVTNLATSLENRNKDVNTWLYWDAGLGEDEDPGDSIAWIGSGTGYTKWKELRPAQSSPFV
jgi:hypothetical protein